MRIATLWQKALVVALVALVLVLVMPAKEASACSGCGCPTNYQVRCGDTLSSIACRYGVSVWQITSWNHIPNPNRIYAGQWLVIYPWCGQAPPPPHGQWYVVRCGDTLSGIAWRFHSSVWGIAQANHIWNINYIRVGQHLWIP